jgi:hypothetical protein
MFSRREAGESYLDDAQRATQSKGDSRGAGGEPGADADWTWIPVILFPRGRTPEETAFTNEFSGSSAFDLWPFAPAEHPEGPLPAGKKTDGFQRS